MTYGQPLVLVLDDSAFPPNVQCRNQRKLCGQNEDSSCLLLGCPFTSCAFATLHNTIRSEQFIIMVQSTPNRFHLDDPIMEYRNILCPIVHLLDADCLSLLVDLFKIPIRGCEAGNSQCTQCGVHALALSLGDDIVLDSTSCYYNPLRIPTHSRHSSHDHNIRYIAGLGTASRNSLGHNIFPQEQRRSTSMGQGHALHE